MRYERKYRIEDQSLAFVEQMIRHHPWGFRTLFPDRQVNNIYFDTPGMTCYKENVAGVAERKKYRVRWYGGLTATEGTKNQLEIKIKNNALGDKERYAFPAFSLSDWNKLGTVVAGSLRRPVSLIPTLLNSYQRSYYGLATEKFRITIDRKLGYCPLIQENQQPEIRHMDEAIIVEIKYDETLEAEANQVLQYIPFRATKNSKYVTGIETSM